MKDCIVSKNLSKGFTLIELLIVVAIVGILTAIAYPSYAEHINKGKRAEARALLLQSQTWMERFYTQNQRYDQNTAGTATTDATLFPAAFNFSPISADASTANYRFTLVLTAGNPNVYSITATQLNTMANDRCGTFVVTNTGARGNTGFSTTAFADAAAAARECWK
jgi:type IV pilus assembly protein PilE